MADNEQPKLFLFLCYKDPSNAIKFLSEAFGFEKVVAYPDEERGGIAHAELKLGEAVVMVQADHEGFEVPHVKNHTSRQGPYITLGSEEAVRELYDRAMKAGAKSLRAPVETAWGNYACDLLDPEGFHWSFGTYVPGNPAW